MSAKKTRGSNTMQRKRPLKKVKSGDGGQLGGRGGRYTGALLTPTESGGNLQRTVQLFGYQSMTPVWSLASLV